MKLAIRSREGTDIAYRSFAKMAGERWFHPAKRR